MVSLAENEPPSDKGPVCCVDTELASDGADVSEVTIRQVSAQQLVTGGNVQLFVQLP